MRIVILIIISLVLSANSALALSCYKANEAEAEQGIRIHSELMVIGLNCQHMASANGKNLYAAYRQFTSENGNLFGQYETILMDYFRKTGQNPEKAINSLRTQFANKISKDAADMRPDIFCSRYAPRIVQASAMNQQDLRKWAATIYPSHPVSRPLCSGQTH